jgi:hypothetical protein
MILSEYTLESLQEAGNAVVADPDLMTTGRGREVGKAAQPFAIFRRLAHGPTDR